MKFFKKIKGGVDAFFSRYPNFYHTFSLFAFLYTIGMVILDAYMKDIGDVIWACGFLVAFYLMDKHTIFLLRKRNNGGHGGDGGNNDPTPSPDPSSPSGMKKNFLDSIESSLDVVYGKIYEKKTTAKKP